MMQKKLYGLLAILAVTISLFLLITYYFPFNYSGIAPSGLISQDFPIQQNNNIYTVTADFEGPHLTIKKSNIIIEGNNHTSGPIKLDHVTNVTIKNLKIDSGRWTINLYHSSNNQIINVDSDNHPITLYHSHNNIVNQNINLAIWITESNNNTIQNSTINRMELRKSTNNQILNNKDNQQNWFVWLELTDSSNNLIYKNQISNATERWISYFGTSTKNLFVANQVTGPFDTECYFQSENNLFYNNNFIDAFEFNNPARDENNQTNNWDNNQQGNYYNTYQGQDTNNDGIGDTPHTIFVNNQDNYPAIAPINLENIPKPQLTLIQTEQQNPVTTLAIIIIVVFAIIIIAIYKKSTLMQTLNRNDKNDYTLVAIGSALSAIFLFIATRYGFGEYLTYPFRFGYATSGQLNRIALVFLILTAITLMLAGLGYRKLEKTQKNSYKNLKFLIVILTSIILIAAALIISQAQPFYNQQYWNRIEIESFETNLLFSQITLTAFILLGINQIMSAKTLQKQETTKYPKLKQVTSILQEIFGTIFIVTTTLFLIFPYPILFIKPEILSIPFLLTQTLCSINFILLRRQQTNL